VLCPFELAMNTAGVVAGLVRRKPRELESPYQRRLQEPMTRLLRQ
jgi:hypothetical protein